MMPNESNQNHHWPAQIPLKVFNNEASQPLLVPPAYEFGSFRLDNINHELLRDGQLVPLTRKALEMLTLLVQHRGRVLEKDELLQRLWAETIVEEANLTQNIYLLRKALGQCARRQSYIETIPKRGYRFIADVKEIWLNDIESEGALGEESGAVVKEAGKLQKQKPSLPAAIYARPTTPISHRKQRQLLSVMVALTICIFGSLADMSLKNKKNEVGATQAIKSIAVLPFKPIGAESGDAHLGLGMTDATITKLSALQQFSVLPTSAIFKFADAAYELSPIGRELGVDAVLEGTVQRAEDRVRVTVRLTGVEDNQLLWAEQFDAHFTDVFAVQDAVSEQVASALKLKLTNEEKQHLAKRYTQNPKAYEAYARGLYFWNKRTEAELKRSIEYFEEAIRIDPQYALAYASLADAYCLIGYYRFGTLSQEEAYKRTKAAALKAIEIDDRIAEAHIALAHVKEHARDLAGAESEFRYAISLSPHHATAHHRYAIFLIFRGRIDEAYHEAQQAQKLDPVSIATNANLALILIYKRDFEQAEAYCKKALEITPDSVYPHLYLGMIYELKDLRDDAFASYKKALEIAPRQGNPYRIALEFYGYACAATNRADEAHQIISELNGYAEQTNDYLFGVAMIHAKLGEADQAFGLLEECARLWPSEVYKLRFDPRIEAVRSDPRYLELMKRYSGLQA